MNIITKPVGKTNVSVTSLSFGCASIGNLGGVVRDADATAVMQHAWEAGIRYFDTAPHYGRGLSEQRIGTFLQTKTLMCCPPKLAAFCRPVLRWTRPTALLSLCQTPSATTIPPMASVTALKAVASGLAPVRLRSSLSMTLATTHTGLQGLRIWTTFWDQGWARCAISNKRDALARLGLG